ncbi:MAG: hypothetical protein Q7U04_04885 [Bacteriovorax sp.]|nr:hypothetical protein [Bacteriovorax sp.]
MRFLSLLVIVSSLISIQSSDASQTDEKFCDEWAKYIDAFDMVPPSKKVLPYSMEKYNGDLIKGGMSLRGEIIVFVPEPSESLMQSWPDPSSKNKLAKTLAEYYEAKKDYNAKVAIIYKGREIKDAIKILDSGKLKQEEDRIINLAGDLKKISLGDTLKKPITGTCFKAYQKLSHERVKDNNFQESKYAGAIRSLNDDLQNCQMGSKISDTNRYNVKTIDEIVEQISKKAESSAVPK